MNIKTIKQYLNKNIGNKIIVVYYGSRNRKERYEGIINKVYNNVFTIVLDNNIVKCFSYVDIITKKIKVRI